LGAQNAKASEVRAPHVSIGLPVYNGEPFIREALDSLLMQTFTDFEVIISDNASSDRTEAICREYATRDKRIRYLRQAKNLGASTNFQFVLEEAVGEYFMWAAADDIRSPDCLQTYLNHIGKAGAVFTTYASFDREKNAVCRIEVPVMSENDTNKKLLRIYFRSNITSMIYGLYRTEILRRYIPFASFDWSDAFFILRFLAESKYNVIKTSEPKYYSCTYGGYKVKCFSGKYLNPHAYFFHGIPYAIKAGGLSIFYHIKTLLISYKINFVIFRESKIR
jgi:glycosyltransferase involved in cell wall biosynthesis